MPEKEKKIPIEQAMSKLEKVVDELENGNISLDDAFKKFETAVKMSKYVKKRLDEYERKIQIIKEDISNEKGYTVEDFDENTDPVNQNTITDDNF